MDKPSSLKLMLGLPGSGKTTFLAAFWYYVRHDAGACALRVLPSDREYLNGISDCWAGGEPQGHTRRGEPIRISLELSLSDTGANSTLVIPDLSGEVFKDHWSHRVWSQDFHRLAADISGVLLFVHPNDVSGPLTIAHETAAADEIRDEITPSPEAGDGTPQRFDPLKVPQQVILIDQLQCLLADPCGHDRLRVALIISAWDEIKGEELSPAEWLQKHVKLLDQFLSANEERLPLRVFGVSAQGGDYQDEEVRKRLLRDPSATNRIEIVAATDLAGDITAPIRWLLSACDD